MMFQRFRIAWETHGSIGLIRHLFRHKLPIHISLVFQKNEPSDSCSVPGLIVERYPTRDSVDPVLLDTLARGRDGRIVRQVDSQFLKGCELWLGRIEGAVEGVCWSRSHTLRSDYFVPLKETDANILSCFVFPECRGKGIYPAMLETMVSLLFAQDQIRNVYIDCKSWNIASIHGIQKAGFILIGKAVRMVLFGKAWIIWSQCKQISQ
jgi:hypothetical protein